MQATAVALPRPRCGRARPRGVQRAPASLHRPPTLDPFFWPFSGDGQNVPRGSGGAARRPRRPPIWPHPACHLLAACALSHSMLAQGKCGWLSKLTAARGLAAAAAARTHALPAGPRRGSTERGGARGASVPATAPSNPPPRPLWPPVHHRHATRQCRPRATQARARLLCPAALPEAVARRAACSRPQSPMQTARARHAR